MSILLKKSKLLAHKAKGHPLSCIPASRGYSCQSRFHWGRGTAVSAQSPKTNDPLSSVDMQGSTRFLVIFPDTSPWHLQQIHTVEFQGEVKRNQQLLSPLRAGQRPCAKEQRVAVLPPSLPRSACTSSRSHLSLHISLSLSQLLAVDASRVPAITSSASRSLLREGHICHHWKRK